MFSSSGVQSQAFKVMPDALLAQAAPVQNTWYPVLAVKKNVRLLLVAFQVAATGETLECRITVDGVVYTITQNAVAGTSYEGLLNAGLLTANTMTTAALGSFLQYRPFILEGQSLQVDIRKTTAAGVGTIYCQVLWQQK